MSQKKRVLYCTGFLPKENNGGGLFCRQNMRQLARLEAIDLHIAVIGGETLLTEYSTFIESLGATFHPIGFDLANRKKLSLTKIYQPFQIYEQLARLYPDTDLYFEMLLDHLKPDIIFINSLLTHVLIPSIFKYKGKIITITQNNESAFYRERLRIKGERNLDLYQYKLAFYEKSIYKASDIVIKLTKGDVPEKLLPETQVKLIEPALDEHPLRWNYQENPTIFFVGNLNHYPNYLAIKWLAEKFSPCLEKIAPHISIHIIGASTDDVPATWQCSNINYLGNSNKEEVIKLYANSSLFIAPIANNLGSKIKVLMALSHGAPTMTTQNALSGIPFVDVIPLFNLDDPDHAAKIAVDLISSKSKLLELHKKLTVHYKEFCDSRSVKWQELFESLANKPPVKRYFRSFLSQVSSGINSWKLMHKKVEIATKSSFGVRTDGLHMIEKVKRKIGFRRVRWTNGDATLRAEFHPWFIPKKIKIHLYPATPGYEKSVKIIVNESEEFEGSVNSSSGTQINLTISDIQIKKFIHIRLKSPITQFPGDPRQLGVAIKSIKLIC